MFDETTQTAPANLAELKQKFIEAKRAKESLELPLTTATREFEAKLLELKSEHDQKYAELYENSLQIDSAFKVADADLREALKVHYEATGEKQYDNDLSVRVNTRLVYDPAKATEWAKDNAPFILVADDKQFKNLDIARTLDFVEEVHSVSAVISTKL